MIYEFNVFQMNVEGHLFWVAKSKVLKGCVGQGDTVEDAIKELGLNETDWIATAKECGIPIPEATIHTEQEQSFSGKISLRISSMLHKESYSYAKKSGVSLNQYFSDAIAHYNGVNYSIDNPQKLISESDVDDNDKTTIINFREMAARNRKPKYNLTVEQDENMEEM